MDFFKDLFSGVGEVVTTLVPVAQTYLQTDAAKDVAKQTATQQTTQTAPAQQAAQTQTTASTQNKVLLIGGGIAAFVMLMLGVVLIAVRRR